MTSSPRSAGKFNNNDLGYGEYGVPVAGGNEMMRLRQDRYYRRNCRRSYPLPAMSPLSKARVAMM